MAIQTIRKGARCERLFNRQRDIHFLLLLNGKNRLVMRLKALQLPLHLPLCQVFENLFYIDSVEQDSGWDRAG